MIVTERATGRGSASRAQARDRRRDDSGIGELIGGRDAAMCPPESLPSRSRGRYQPGCCAVIVMSFTTVRPVAAVAPKLHRRGTREATARDRHRSAPASVPLVGLMRGHRGRHAV